MKTIKIHFFFPELGHEKGKILIFHGISLNNDISINIADIVLKLCILVLLILAKGSVSQIFHLGPSFYFMQS